MSDNPFQSPTFGSEPVVAVSVLAKSMRTARELRAVASSQRMLLWAIAAFFVGAAIMTVAHARDAPELERIIGSIGVVTCLAALLVGVFSVMRLASNLYRNVAAGILNGLAMLMPLIGFILVIMLLKRSSDLLRNHGIRVGMFRANEDDLQRVESDFE